MRNLLGEKQKQFGKCSRRPRETFCGAGQVMAAIAWETQNNETWAGLISPQEMTGLPEGPLNAVALFKERKKKAQVTFISLFLTLPVLSGLGISFLWPVKAFFFCLQPPLKVFPYWTLTKVSLPFPCPPPQRGPLHSLTWASCFSELTFPKHHGVHHRGWKADSGGSLWLVQCPHHLETFF